MLPIETITTIRRYYTCIGLILLTGIFPSGYLYAQCDCGALPPPETGEVVVYANSLSDIQDALDSATVKTTIYVNSGVYPITSQWFVNIGKPNITLRSTSGNRADVVFRGEGMDADGMGHGIYVDADNVTIADVTVRDVQNHGFFVTPGSDNCLFHNVHGIDCGEQIFKASGSINEEPKNNGIIECSTLEYTTTLDDGDDGWYTNGIDLLNCHDWIIRDNVIRNIKHNPAITSTPAGPAILIWHNSSGTSVVRNRIIECDFGISFGNAGQGDVSHTGGIIENNFVLGYEGSDFAIGLIYAPDAQVIHNTVYSPGNWPWSIEARFSESQNGVIMNNFTDEPILSDRDGASYATSGNVTSAAASDFVDAASGNLHLVSSTVAAVDAGDPIATRTSDIDCESISGAPDAGADEYTIPTAIDTPPIALDATTAYPVPATGHITFRGKHISQISIYTIHGQLRAHSRMEISSPLIAALFLPGIMWHTLPAHPEQALIDLSYNRIVMKCKSPTGKIPWGFRLT